MRILPPLIGLLFSLSLSAEGFRNPAPGAIGLGQSGGRIAFVDDASAALHNPANLVELEASEVSLAPTFIYLTSEFTLDAGPVAKTTDAFKVLPNFFMAVPGDRWAAGLSVTVPFGLGNEYEQTGAFGPEGPFRYLLPYYSELRTIRISPAVAFRLMDCLSIGAGVDFMWSQLRLEQFFPPLDVPGMPGATLVDGETIARLKANGWGTGAHAAITWKLTQRDRLALTWRAAIDVDHSGNGTIGNLTPLALQFGFTPESPVETEIRFPQIITLGYGRALTRRLFAEAQVEWVQFSRFQSLDLDLANNTPLFGGGNVTAQNWENTMTYGGSLRYQIDAQSQIFGSYHYFESPVPDGTISTTIADANQNAFTVGFQRRGFDWSFGLAYSYVLYDTREVAIAGFPGRLKTQLHLGSLELTRRF